VREESPFKEVDQSQVAARVLQFAIDAQSVNQLSRLSCGKGSLREDEPRISD